VSEKVTLYLISVLASAGRGDARRIDITDTLFNAVPQFGMAATEVVGSDRVTVTQTASGGFWLEAEAMLPDGTISSAGAITPHTDETTTFPVTGGTGRYENASGELLVGAATERVANTYTLDISPSI
jgi:hypothetical protein